MPGDKKRDKKQEMDAHERLKWETARRLGLDDDLANAGDELTVREAGKIGGNMVRELIKAGEKALAEENNKKQQ
ncbi:MAG: small, acid-soluble spore protein, alpha/beta type [Bacillota bacterium]|nr:small, acid-soluble spore protein, alpha/beta type [Bacillota bacterium]